MTGTNLLSNCLAVHQRQSMLGFQAIDFCHCGLGFSGMNSLGSRLNNKHVTGNPILGPFDVHRLRMSGQFGVMIFDETCPVCEFLGFVVG